MVYEYFKTPPPILVLEDVQRPLSSRVAKVVCDCGCKEEFVLPNCLIKRNKKHFKNREHYKKYLKDNYAGLITVTCDCGCGETFTGRSSDLLRNKLHFRNRKHHGLYMFHKRMEKRDLERKMQDAKMLKADNLEKAEGSVE